MIPKFRARDERGNWHIGLLTFMFGQYAIVNEADENSVYLIDKETVGQSNPSRNPILCLSHLDDYTEQPPLLSA